MSSDQVPGAPSFGDLFDDPDAPPAPVVAPTAAPTAAPATSDRAPEPDEAPPVATPAEADRALDPEHEPHPAIVVPPLVAAPTGTAADGPTDPPPSAQADPAADEHPGAEPEPAGHETAEPEPLEVAPLGAAPLVASAFAAAPWDGTVDPGASSAPAGRVDTGRLYRSAGAEGPSTLDAIPAIDPSYVPRIPVDVLPEPAATEGPGVQGGTGLTYTGVMVVVIVATVLVGFADALINHKLGPITGVAMAVSSIYAAFVVRKADIWAAVVAPPLAFLVATLTAGQLTLDSSGSLAIRESYMVFRTLAVNAPWILGTTLVCLVIVLVRRFRH